MPSHRRTGFTLLEILVAIGIIALLMGILLPTVEVVRHRAYISNCASNLRQIGQAVVLYSNDNHGQLPRTTYVPGAPVQLTATGSAAVDPFRAGGPAANDVAAALFLLMRVAKLPPAVMICPYNDVHDYIPEPADPLTHSNFTDIKKNLGYSIANPYPDAPATTAGYKWTGHLSAEFALAGDINPGTLAPYDDVTTPTAKSAWSVMKKANSENHERDGQNVLYGDGHVTWNKNPFCGVAGDNIYTNRASLLEASPVDRTDSVLLPTDD